MTRYNPNATDPVYGDMDHPPRESREEPNDESAVRTPRCVECGKRFIAPHYAEDTDRCQRHREEQ